MLTISQWIAFALVTLLSAGGLRAAPAAAVEAKRTGHDYYVIGNPMSSVGMYRGWVNSTSAATPAIYADEARRALR